MTRDRQVSIYDVLAENEPKREIVLPKAQPGETVYTIPEDVWNTRCRYCIHKNAEKNIPIPAGVIWRYSYEKVLPCRVMGVSRPNEMPGECMSFAPIHNLYGICATCKHDNCFHEGWCTKEDHAEQRRVFYGQDYGNAKADYWGRHRLSVCDDYDPESDDLIRMD